MTQFFNKISHIFQTLFQNEYGHQRLITVNVLVISFILDFFLSYIGTLVFSLIFGLIFELTYCFVPFKEYQLWRFKVKYPDYKEFFDNASELYFTHYKKLNSENIYYVYIALLIFTIIKCVFLIF